LIIMVFALHSFAQNETFDLWSGKVPGEEKPKAAHEISPNKKNETVASLQSFSYPALRFWPLLLECNVLIVFFSPAL